MHFFLNITVYLLKINRNLDKDFSYAFSSSSENSKKLYLIQKCNNVFFFFSNRLTHTPGDLCPARFGCPSPARERCHQLIQEYHAEQRAPELGEAEEQFIKEEEDKSQILKHTVLLLLLLCSMFVVSSSFMSLLLDYVKQNILQCLSIFMYVKLKHFICFYITCHF